MTKEERAKPEEADEEPNSLSELAEELSKPVPEEDEEGQTFELSPGEAEKLRRSMARLQSTINPRIGFKFSDVLGKSSFLKNYENVTKMGRFTLPESTMKNFVAISRLSEDVSKFGRVNLPESPLKGLLGKNFSSSALANIMPALSVEPSWMKQFKLINSDLYKVAGLGQSNLTTLSSVLAKNADFSFNTSAAKLASQFASQQASWLQTIGPLLEKLKTGFYPANLEDIANLAFEEVEAVVMLDGIALYGVPRTEIAERLIRAETTQARRAILGRRWKAVSADCRAAVEGCSYCQCRQLRRLRAGGT